MVQFSAFIDVEEQSCSSNFIGNYEDFSQMRSEIIFFKLDGFHLENTKHLIPIVYQNFKFTKSAGEHVSYSFLNQSNVFIPHSAIMQKLVHSNISGNERFQHRKSSIILCLVLNCHKTCKILFYLLFNPGFNGWTNLQHVSLEILSDLEGGNHDPFLDITMFLLLVKLRFHNFDHF